MGKGSKERPTNRQRYGESYERMFRKRCLKHRKAECPVCNPKPRQETPPDWWDRLKDSDDRGFDED